MRSLGNDAAKNVVVFATDNSLSAPSDSKNNILILGEDPTSDIDSSFGSQEKKRLVLVSVKQTKNVT